MNSHNFTKTTVDKIVIAKEHIGLVVDRNLTVKTKKLTVSLC